MGICTDDIKIYKGTLKKILYLAAPALILRCIMPRTVERYSHSIAIRICDLCGISSSESKEAVFNIPYTLAYAALAYYFWSKVFPVHEHHHTCRES
jgi:hypothetical protein